MLSVYAHQVPNERRRHGMIRRSDHHRTMSLERCDRPLLILGPTSISRLVFTSVALFTVDKHCSQIV
jgi:hypothetical protein